MERVRALYDLGLYVQAFRAAESLGAPESWTTTTDRVLGGRLLANVGAPARARLLLARTWRSARRDAEALYFHASHVLEGRGPVACWELAQRIGELEGAPPEHEASWCLVRAEALAGLRDFEAAEALLTRARALHPRSSWTEVVHARVLAAQDRHAEALERARVALADRPWYRPAVNAVAGLLQQLGRDDEALAFLVDADARLEASGVALQRAALERELEQHTAATRSYLRAAELSPALEWSFFQGLCFSLGEVAYRAGAIDEAMHFLRMAPLPGHREFAERLAADPARRRVRLPVKFVRQHHMTCAPATLAAISTSWGVAADHLEVAEEICYDGTPSRSERRWAERSGFVAREFTVTWEVAVALLDRGVPFTLTQVEPGSAHLVAVVGYDPLRRSLLIRDPSAHWVREFDTDAMLERYAAHGPRGMLLVPHAQAERLVGIELPDAELYDHLHALELALDAHQRDAAAQQLAALERAAPDHRLALVAAHALTAYDADPLAMLAVVRRQRAVHPDEINLLLCERSLLAQLERRDEQRELLRQRASAPGAHPLLQVGFAEELAGDAREHDRVHWLVHLAHQRGPGDGRGLMVSARAHWLAGRRDEAALRFRLAACVGDKDEQRAATCFSAMATVDGPDPALDYLRRRVDRLGARSGGPALTLARALIDQDREAEAVDVLEAGMQCRPQDDQLPLEAAMVCARIGREARARELLDGARGRARPGSWLRAAAQVARSLGDRETAAARWRELLEREPLACDAHDALTELLAASDGPVAAAAHMRAAVERFPHHRGLSRLLARCLVDVDRREAVARLRADLDAHGDDVWSRRELALRLAELGEHDAARAEIARVHELEPRSPEGWMVLSWVERLAGRPISGAAALRRALELAPAHAPAVHALAALATTPAEQRALLELLRLVDDGRGLPGASALAFVESGASSWLPEEALELVRASSRRRPDDAEAAAAVIAQCLQMSRKDDGLAEARRASQLWPMRARAWLDLARVHRQRGESAEAREALERARHLDGGLLVAARQLAQLDLAAGQVEAARAVLEHAARRAPEDAATRLALAHLEHEHGQGAGALERVLVGLRSEPEDDDAWDCAITWAEALGRRDEVVALARSLADRPRPSPTACLVLAHLLAGDAGALDERLALIDRATARAPLFLNAHDMRVRVLSEAGRHDEASAACRPAAWAGEPPLLLRGRGAWVRAQRGDLRGAVGDMEALLRDAPGYDFGLNHLNRWCAQQKDFAPIVRLGAALAACRPGDAEVCLLLASAHEASKDAPGHERWLRRALDLDPRHEIAAQRLFDVCLARNDLDAAADQLKRCAPENAFAAARAVQLELRNGDLPAALAAFERTCTHAGDEPWPVESSAKALERRRRPREVLAVLESQLSRGATVAVGVVRMWAAFMVVYKWWPEVWIRLRRLRARGELGVAVTSAYLERVGRRWHVLPFVLLFRSMLYRSARTWSAASYALLQLNAYRLTRRWSRDWREREGLKAYMLVNVAIAARALGDDATGAEAARRALTLPADHSRAIHHRWLSFDAAVAGDIRVARQLQKECGEPDHVSDRYLDSLIQALVELRSPGPPLGDRARLARYAIDAAIRGRPRSKALWRATLRAARAVHEAHPGFASWWWWMSWRLARITA